MKIKTVKGILFISSTFGKDNFDLRVMIDSKKNGSLSITNNKLGIQFLVDLKDIKDLIKEVENDKQSGAQGEVRD